MNISAIIKLLLIPKTNKTNNTRKLWAEIDCTDIFMVFLGPSRKIGEHYLERRSQPLSFSHLPIHNQSVIQHCIMYIVDRKYKINRKTVMKSVDWVENAGSYFCKNAKQKIPTNTTTKIVYLMCSFNLIFFG